MSDVEEMGIVETGQEEREIEWRLDDFLSVVKRKDDIKSPDFHFADTDWYFELRPKKLARPRAVSLFFLKTDSILCSVEYNLGFKRKRNGNVEYFSRGIFKNNVAWIGPFYVNVSAIQQQKSQLLPSDIFIITCRLKRENTPQNLFGMPALPQSEELIKLDTLSENFKNVFANRESCDVTLYVVDKEYKAHKTVLVARSSVFAAMFQHETSEKQTGIITIPDCDPDSFEQFLEFLYSGKLKIQSSHIALNLYETSEKYEVLELKIFCSEFLKKNLTEENFCDVVILADNYDDKPLLSEAQHFFQQKLKQNFGDI